MDFVDLLKMCVEQKGSDIFITAGAAPSIKINGVINPVTEKPLNPEAARKVVYDIMNDKQRSEFEQSSECNFAISAAGVGRFRVNVFVQRSNVGMVLRRIETSIPTFEDLKLPPILKDLAMTKRGMVLFVGGTGTGKSTSLASMIGYRNRTSKGHIITIEDPIEYVHQHDGCIVTQREVGVDTVSYDVALKNTLRQAPDVILIGEIRHQETMDYAIAFSETGHLVLATLHANNANQAMDRIINFFPEERRGQLFMDLSLNLKAVVAQLLIPRKDGKGRRAAIEVLINTPLMADLIGKGEVHEIKALMKESTEHGMQTFDQALFRLYKEGEITRDDALLYADSANEVRLMIKLDESEGDPRKFVEGFDGLTIEDQDDESFFRE
ncbi:MAG: PilT/PilU family type 4a pilus ATPase [Gammaproteobacteria bacterium]|jgi:twitching motility protein PilU|nr:PilT/PilU family type 4a pilus ATPase [Gammaproteobacteria bacterium]